MLVRGYGFLNDFGAMFAERFLGHYKTIGWYRGCPVYSTYLAPALSKPCANELVQLSMSHLKHEPLPSMVHIGVTDDCNAHCEGCSFFGAMNRPEKSVLSTHEMKNVLSSCQDLGVSIIHFVGGEPLLREDLPELIMHINKDKSVCSIFTNGWHLEEKCRELKKSGLMMAIVSLDGHTAEKHDKLKGLPGLFIKAIKGIKACQNSGLLTGIATRVAQSDLEDGSFEKIIHLAGKMKVNELIVFDTVPIGMYSPRGDLGALPLKRDVLFEIIGKYNKRKDFPGIFSYTRFKESAVMGCSAGRSYFYITPYGDVCPCDFTSVSVGNISARPLYLLWSQLVQKRKECGFANSLCDLDGRQER